MKTEKIRRALELINVIYAGDVYREALAELAVLEQRIADFEEEDEMHFRLVELQHSRMKGAEKAWQIAHNRPNTWPDLGDLIEWMGKQIAWLREALEFCAARLTNDPLAAHERIRAALSATPTGKVLVDVEKLREIENIPMHEESGGVWTDTCPVCNGEEQPGAWRVKHASDCWLGNILKTARGGGNA